MHRVAISVAASFDTFGASLENFFIEKLRAVSTCGFIADALFQVLHCLTQLQHELRILFEE